MTTAGIAVYGSGGFACEVAWLAQECGHQVVCFIDDDASKIGRNVNEIPVLSLAGAVERFPAAMIAAGIGNPSARESVTTRAVGLGLRPASLVHPRVEKSRWVTLGAGIVVCAGSILTTNIRVGDHVQINLDCTIGHDVNLGEYATLAPGVHVSGWVTLGRRAYVGTGATIINGTQEHPLVVGDDAIVGAGACVTRSVKAGVTVVGVPAKPMAPR
jgi:sugar O-acyltransferase (sialic acid O-acetyltransferase NeuD family)